MHQNEEFDFNSVDSLKFYETVGVPWCHIFVNIVCLKFNTMKERLVWELNFYSELNDDI